MKNTQYFPELEALSGVPFHQHSDTIDGPLTISDIEGLQDALDAKKEDIVTEGPPTGGNVSVTNEDVIVLFPVTGTTKYTFNLTGVTPLAKGRSVKIINKNTEGANYTYSTVVPKDNYNDDVNVVQDNATSLLRYDGTQWLVESVISSLSVKPLTATGAINGPETFTIYKGNAVGDIVLLNHTDNELKGNKHYIKNASNFTVTLKASANKTGQFFDLAIVDTITLPAGAAIVVVSDDVIWHVIGGSNR